MSCQFPTFPQAEIVTWEGPSGLGLVARKWWLEKVPKIFQTQKVGDFCTVNWNPSKKSPNKKHKYKTLRKIRVLKNIFLFYRNCQKRQFGAPKMWDRLKQNSLGSTALGVVWSQLQPPKISWKNRISYPLKSSPQKINKPKNGKPPAVFISFPQITPMIFSLLVTPNKNKSFPNFVQLGFAWSW